MKGELMSQTLLYNAGILTMDAQQQFNNGAILIDGDRISAIGPSADLLARAPNDATRIDLSGCWILPGLVNIHVHTSQQMGRGLGDDVDLLVWLRERIWPYESILTEEDSYLSTLLFGLEQIRSGVTCFSEAGGQHVNGMGRAVTELGLRATLCRSTLDVGTGLPDGWQETTEQALDAQIANFERWHGAAEGRIRAWFGLRTIFNNSDELILCTKELADQYGVGIQMHVAEVREEVEFSRETRGAGTVTHLERLGVLGPNLLAAHSVWLTDEEIDLFAARDVKVAHCPAAAMRVLGFAKIPEMLAKGICVGLGTDSPPCNNRSTLIDEMWLASLIHKGRLLDPTTMPAETILTMVTNHGARAVLWDDEIGSLKPGKKADLVVINPQTANMLPVYDPVANMVSAMQARNIQSVMVDGHWLMRDGTILSVDEKAILAEAHARAAVLYERAGIKLPNRFHIVD
jgi:5-methylthioadenosine/S-adenosylhomocysteine deaminase